MSPDNTSGYQALRTRLLPLVAVALMLVAVVLHQVHVRVNHLAPDLAGGFGMFAFIDNSGWRTVIVTVEDANGTVWSFDLEAMGRELNLSSREIQRVRGMPSQGALAEAAELVRTHEWFADPVTSEISGAGSPGQEQLDVVDVRITVYGVTWDDESDEARRIVITDWAVGA